MKTHSAHPRLGTFVWTLALLAAWALVPDYARADDSAAPPKEAAVAADSSAATDSQTATDANSATDAATPVAIDVEKIFAGDVPHGIDDLRAMQDRIQALSKRVIPATVGIRVGAAQGSGVIISADGYVLTAGHVVGQPNRDVTFILHNGRSVKGQTLGMNGSIDSGLMKITDEGEYPFVEMGKSEPLRQGQWCLTAGHPGGYQRGRLPVVRVGRILASSEEVVVTDTPLIGGDSGGPLFDMDGRVIAIHSRIGGPLIANMHVPVDTYHDTWDRLAAAEAWGIPQPRGPYIGVVWDQTSEEARIAEVQPDSPAAKAGIKPGDVIVKFGDEEVKDFQSLGNLVRSRKPGDKVELNVRRGEKTLTLSVTIGRQG